MNDGKIWYALDQAAKIARSAQRVDQLAEAAEVFFQAAFGVDLESADPKRYRFIEGSVSLKVEAPQGVLYLFADPSYRYSASFETPEGWRYQA
jgi:hypothetical protein